MKLYGKNCQLNQSFKQYLIISSKDSILQQPLLHKHPAAIAYALTPEDRCVVPNTRPLDFDLPLAGEATFTPEGALTRVPLASVHDPVFG